MEIIFLIFISLLFVVNGTLANPGTIDNFYPFSIKRGYNEVVIFLENDIKIFDVTKTNTGTPIESIFASATPPRIDCISGEEKGGIYFKGYYYTSCQNPDNSKEFKIKVFYGVNTTPVKIFPDTGYYICTKGTIRFFTKTSINEIISVAWIDNIKLNLLEINHQSPSNIQLKDFTIPNIANDIDCLFIKKHQRTVCIYGKYPDDLGKSQCTLGMFEDTNIISNKKSLYFCPDHYTRKMRLSTDAKQNTENSDIFYYYYVDMTNKAFIVPFRLVSQTEIKSINDKIYEVMSNCNINQHSYDIAEDKFLGYDVFICVDSMDPSKIKIQLFKIENDNIMLYGDNPFTYNKAPSGSTLSMINFVVLKKSLNFGFLSYRVNGGNAYYTIINQPTCNNYDNSVPKLSPFTDTNVIFTDNIQNDGYDGVEVILDNKPGFTITPIDGNEVIIHPNIYKNEESDFVEFTFRAKNLYYESEVCTAKIDMIGCHKNCKKCLAEGIKYNDQLCIECKEEEGYYKINNFPSYSDNSKINCCKEGDCPDYFYLNNNQFELCHPSCLACNGDSKNDCITCYNENELKNTKYSNDDRNIIQTLKRNQNVGDNYFDFWENGKKLCEKGDKEHYYFDPETYSYKECYHTCQTCHWGGNSLNHNCVDCKARHYHLGESSSCLTEEEAGNDYFINNEDGNEKLEKCSKSCYKCKSSNNKCKKCASGYHPKCVSEEEELYECLESKPDHYYLDSTCYRECDSNCEKCDKGPEGDTKNCLSCDDEAGFF